jgi:hypothetical protein
MSAQSSIGAAQAFPAQWRSEGAKRIGSWAIYKQVAPLELESAVGV